jgi:predicted AAA+ superfamily ATPase
MKPFHTVAVPHRDILEGKLELNIFAANLWKVYRGEAPSEYQDSNEFFRKTFLTKGLRNLLNVVKRRLSGEGGDPVIQLQTDPCC